MGILVQFRQKASAQPAKRSATPATVEPPSAPQRPWKEPAPRKEPTVMQPATPKPAKKWRWRSIFWLKGAQAIALAVAVCFSLGASDASSRYNDLSHRMMCTCSCAQMLGECNHVGCPSSGPMLNELSAAISGGSTDKQILDSFVAKYGATVLAAPTTEGFNLVAWIAPFAVFAAALLGTILLVRHWSVGKSRLATEPATPEMDALRDRIRHETGEEGGF
jgi:cytochrome c-type biogenesis protein CcmH/NrfF